VRPSGGTPDGRGVAIWLPPFAVIFATLVDVASGIYPAMRAAALSPVAALKYE
jgi:ABC-type lipoprotein release transport system permease subunit